MAGPVKFSSTIYLLLLVLVATVALPAYAYDPKLRWQTIETEHFKIHYHQGESLLAYKGARVFEEIHDILVPELGNALRRPLDVVIVDPTDDANGFASSSPYPSITLYATAPMARASLEGYDDFMWAIFVHEYTHILHIDTTEGINLVWRFLFGGNIKPNRHLPGWMIEGFAVYNETHYTGGGRNRSSWADMLVRMSVLENRFPALGMADGYNDAWPGGYYRYIWGGRFHQYVAEQYGHGIWTEMSHRHAAQLIPFIIPSQKVFDKPLTKLWKEWEADLRYRYRAQQMELLQEGLTDEELLCDTPNMATRPTISADGQWVYHNYRYYRGPGVIRRMHVDGTSTQILSRHWATQGMAVSKDGETLYFAAMRPYAIDYDFFDLYRFDVNGKRPWRRERLTHGARATDPDLHPDQERIICVVNGLAQGDLALWSEADGIRRITATQDHTQFSDPEWSPDGETIAVSVWLPGGYRDILLYDDQGNVIRRLTHDKAVDLEPTWSPCGRYVLFSSDRTGIYNIFAFRLEDGVLLKVTNVLSGAFHPAISPDQVWLLYEGYNSRGRDMRRAPYDPTRWAEYTVEPPPLPDSTLPLPPAAEQVVPSRKYNPLPSLFPPRYWLPNIQNHDTWTDWTFSGETGGRDAVRQHYWGAALNYRTGHKFLGFNGYYELTALRPNFRIGYYNYSLSRGRIWLDHQEQQTNIGNSVDGITLGEDSYLERRDRAYLSVSLPLHARHKVEVNYQFDYHQPLRDTVPDDAYLPSLPGIGTYNSMGLSYTFSHTRSYRYSVSPESGFQGSVSADLVQPWLGAIAKDWTDEPLTQARTIITAEARGYISMPWRRNHVLALRGATGTTFGVPESGGTFRLGGSYGQGSYIGTPSHGYPLHGYSSGAMTGDRLVVLSSEYRFPLFFLERGLGVLPIYIRGVHAAVIVDVGQVWSAYDYPTHQQLADGDVALGDLLGAWIQGFRTGTAVEISADIVPLWQGMLRAKMGYQMGFASNGMKFGPESFYFQMGTSF